MRISLLKALGDRLKIKINKKNRGGEITVCTCTSPRATAEKSESARSFIMECI
jgi:hypothetical protein